MKGNKYIAYQKSSCSANTSHVLEEQREGKVERADIENLFPWRVPCW